MDRKKPLEERVLTICLLYLSLCLIGNFIFLAGFVLLSFHLAIPFVQLWAAFPLVVGMLQILVWLIIFQTIISEIRQRLVQKSRVLTLTVFSIFIDIVLLIFVHTGPAFNLPPVTKVVDLLWSSYPSASTLYEFYIDHRHFISSLFQILNPIPFGAAAFIVPLFMGLWRKDDLETRKKVRDG